MGVSKYSAELRERAVRMVAECGKDHGSEWSAIRRRGPWRGVKDVEFATLSWVDWFNNRRLLGPLGDRPPAEFEADYYHQTGTPAAVAGLN